MLIRRGFASLLCSFASLLRGFTALLRKFASLLCVYVLNMGFAFLFRPLSSLIEPFRDLRHLLRASSGRGNMYGKVTEALWAASSPICPTRQSQPAGSFGLNRPPS